jgi:protocatechuate 3,4-dioxygenase beta subunit
MNTTTSHPVSSASSAPDELLADVLRRLEHAKNPRLKTITEAAVRHLHAFAREVGLQRDEWFTGIQFLTATGKICDDVRQEFILLSDSLGLSTLVEMITHDASAGTTDNTVLGPFYVPGSPERTAGESMVIEPDDGDRVVVRGRVTDTAGNPLANVKLDVWQNATNGFYACQQPGIQHADNLRAVYRTAEDGTYAIRTVRPVPYPIPDDGPAGQLLKANGREWFRPGHLHYWVSHPGYKDLITHVFDQASDYLLTDAVFGVRPSLIRPFTVDEHGELSATFDIVLDRAG